MSCVLSIVMNIGMIVNGPASQKVQLGNYSVKFAQMPAPKPAHCSSHTANPQANVTRAAW